MNDRPSGGWSDEPQRMILAAGISVFLSRRHRFGTDTVLLSRFAQPRAQDRCVELLSLIHICGVIDFPERQRGGTH